MGAGGKAVGGRLVRAAELAFVFAAGVVGAGFASGREVYQFFARHGPSGVVGSLLAGLLFAVGGLLAEAGAARSRRWSLSGLVAFVLGPWSPLFEGTLVLFLFATLGIVFAGGNELLAGALPVPAARVVWPVATGLLVAAGPSAVGRMQSGLVALLAVAVVGVALGHVRLDAVWRLDGSSAWPLSSVAYAGYNLLLAIPYFLVVAGRAPAASRRLGILAGALLLAVLLGAETATLHPHRQPLASEPLPMVVAAGSLGPLFGAFYRLALMGATLAAALSYLAALTERLAPRGSRPWIVPVAIALATVPVSAVGLVRLIGLVYPIMGVLGAAFFLALAFRLLLH
jgi:uncharacterized membrane protein YkvI